MYSIPTRIDDKGNICDCDAGFGHVRGQYYLHRYNIRICTVAMIAAIPAKLFYQSTSRQSQSHNLSTFRQVGGSCSNMRFWSSRGICEWSAYMRKRSEPNTGDACRRRASI